jgi:hypothetical protein
MSRTVRRGAAPGNQRLLNNARATGRPFNELLQYYAMERCLFRLAIAPHRAVRAEGGAHVGDVACVSTQRRAIRPLMADVREPPNAGLAAVSRSDGEGENDEGRERKRQGFVFFEMGQASCRFMRDGPTERTATAEGS